MKSGLSHQDKREGSYRSNHQESDYEEYMRILGHYQRRRNSMLANLEDRSLFQRYIDKKDVEARDEIIYRNYPLIIVIAQNLKTDSLSTEDLVQAGLIHLIEQLDALELNSFTSSFCAVTAHKGMQLVIDSQDIETVEFDTEKHGGETFGPDAIYDAHELRHMVNTTLKTILSPRELSVLLMRYGIDNPEPHTLKKIGKVFSRTKEWARWIEVQALKRVRRTENQHVLREWFDYSFEGNDGLRARELAIAILGKNTNQELGNNQKRAEDLRIEFLLNPHNNSGFSDRSIALYFDVSIEAVRGVLPREEKIKLLKQACYNTSLALNLINRHKLKKVDAIIQLRKSKKYSIDNNGMPKEQK